MELERIEGKTFGAERVEIDGKYFDGCNFERTTIVYKGGCCGFNGPSTVVDNRFEFSLDVNAASCLKVLAYFGILVSPVIDVDGTEIEAAKRPGLRLKDDDKPVEEQHHIKLTVPAPTVDHLPMPAGFDAAWLNGLH